MKKNAFPILLAVLSLCAFACTLFIGGPDYPADPIQVSPDAAQSLRDQVQQAIESGSLDGPITFQFTESQITSYVAERLAKEANPILTEPKVFLRNGQIEVFGKFHKGYFLANLASIVNISVDAEGHPKIDIVSTNLGPFPVPQALNHFISATIEEAYTGSLGPVATGFRLENITIADGVMTLTGRIK